MSAHTYRYYARLTPGDQVPSVWCGDINGPNVHMVREWRWMLLARLHAAWRNWRRPEPDYGDLERAWAYEREGAEAKAEEQR